MDQHRPPTRSRAHLTATSDLKPAHQPVRPPLLLGPLASAITTASAPPSPQLNQTTPTLIKRSASPLRSSFQLKLPRLLLSAWPFMNNAGSHRYLHAPPRYRL